MSLSAKEIALFYGAKAKVIRATTKAGDEIWDGLIGKNVTINAENLVYAHSAEVKPILRPLSDMSEDEAVSFANEGSQHNFTLEHFDRFIEDGGKIVAVTFDYEGRQIGYWLWNCNPKQVAWQLENAFDIFGWIPEGKAISALELEPNPYE